MPPLEHHIYIFYKKDPAAPTNRIAEALGLQDLLPAAVWSKGGLVITATDGYMLPKEELLASIKTCSPPLPDEGKYCDVLATDMTQLKACMRRLVELEVSSQVYMKSDDSLFSAQKAVDGGSWRECVRRKDDRGVHGCRYEGCACGEVDE